MEDNLQNYQNSISSRLEGINLESAEQWTQLLEIAQSLFMVANHQQWLDTMTPHLKRIFRNDSKLIQGYLSYLGRTSQDLKPPYSLGLNKLRNSLRELNKKAAMSVFDVSTIIDRWDIDYLLESLAAINTSNFSEATCKYLFALFHQIRLASAEDFENMNLQLAEEIKVVFKNDVGKVIALLNWLETLNEVQDTHKNSREALKIILKEIHKNLASQIRASRHSSRPAMGIDAEAH